MYVFLQYNKIDQYIFFCFRKCALKLNLKNNLFKIYFSDDFAEIFEKPIISKTKLKETQEEKRNEIKFFPEVKSPLEALLEYTDKASEKKREEWNDFEHFEEFPNHEKFFRKPGKKKNNFRKESLINLFLMQSVTYFE